MDNNNAKVGGILTIVSGAFGFLQMAMFVFVGIFFRWIFRLIEMSSNNPPSDRFGEMFLGLFSWFYIAFGIFYGIIGVFTIICGIYALKRKNWGLALAGSIAGALTNTATGIPAIVFIALARNNFIDEKPSVTQ